MDINNEDFNIIHTIDNKFISSATINLNESEEDSVEIDDSDESEEDDESESDDSEENEDSNDEDDGIDINNEKNIKLIINENYLFKQNSIKGQNVIIENIMNYNTDIIDNKYKKNINNDEDNILNIIKEQNEYSKKILLELYKNYKIKNLRLISQYYNLNKSKYKEKIINNIIDYELDLVNLIKVKNRFNLWKYLYILKSDLFFKIKLDSII
jgi:hypothetical protein